MMRDYLYTISVMREEKPKAPVSHASDGKSENVTMVIFGTIADTTWRMFIPPFTFSLIGYGIDRLTGTRPVGVLVGLGLGVVTAGLLTFQQYRKVSSTMGDNK